MKMFKKITLAVTLLAMNAVDAKGLAGKAQPAVTQPIATQETAAAKAAEALKQQQMGAMKPQQGAAPSQMPVTLTQEEWDKIEDKLDEIVDSGNLYSALERIKQIKRMNLTRKQKSSLRRIEQNIGLKTQLIMQQSQIEKEKTKRRQGTKWFSGWWGTESGKIEDYKTMIADKLDDAENYPTLKSKQEALDLGIEFFEAGYNDANIMKKAAKALKTELPRGPETAEQVQINALIVKLREAFGFNIQELSMLLSPQDRVKYFEKYLGEIKTNIKSFVVDNINNANAMALLRAIASESKRVTTMIAILSGKMPSQKKVPQEIVSPWGIAWENVFGTSKTQTPVQQEKAPVATVPQGRPSGPTGKPATSTNE